MKKSLTSPSQMSAHGFRYAALVAVMSASLGAPVVAWSSPTLLADSTVSIPLCPVSGMAPIRPYRSTAVIAHFCNLFCPRPCRLIQAAPTSTKRP